MILQKIAALRGVPLLTQEGCHVPPLAGRVRLVVGRVYKPGRNVQSVVRLPPVLMR